MTTDDEAKKAQSEVRKNGIIAALSSGFTDFTEIPVPKGQLVTENLFRAFTVMVNTAQVQNLPDNDTSAPVEFTGPRHQKVSGLMVLKIFSKKQEIDTDDPDADRTPRNEIAVICTTKEGVDKAQSSAEQNSSGDTGDCFGEWFQETGIPYDMELAVGNPMEYSFAENDDVDNHALFPLLQKTDVSEFIEAAVDEAGESLPLDQQMFVLYFYKGDKSAA